MENKNQTKIAKNTNSKNSKGVTKMASVRIRSESKKRAFSLLEQANRKVFGRKVKLDDLIDLAIGLVAKEHIETLQNRSMTNEDRKEDLRRKYVALHGPISKDEFTGFMMTPAFSAFLQEQQHQIGA